MPDTILVPKDTPDWQDLLTQTEYARSDAEKLAHQDSGNVVLENGTDTGIPSALVLRDQSFAYKKDAETAKKDAETARDVSQSASNNAVENSTLDGSIQPPQDENDLPTADSGNSGERWVVYENTNGITAIYQSDGSSWNKQQEIIQSGEKGQPGGVASLDSQGQINDSEVPKEVVSLDESAIPGTKELPLSWESKLIDEPFPDGMDPVLYHRDNFQDNEYRIIFTNTSTNKFELWKTPDFTSGSYTQINSDLFPNEATGGANTFQDGAVRKDGTFLLYQNDGSDGTGVWKGGDLQSLTYLGTVISTENDCGVYYEEPTDTVHIYTEDADNQIGVGSKKLSHWTTPANDLTNATQQQDAVDVKDRVWKTGDADITKIGNYYYLFADRTREDVGGHPSYNTAVWISKDLYNWSILSPRVTRELAGDLTIVKRDGIYEGFSEYSGGDFGIYHFQLYPTSTPSQIGLNNGLSIVPENFGYKIKDGGLELEGSGIGLEIRDELDPIIQFISNINGTPKEASIKLDDASGDFILQNKNARDIIIKDDLDCVLKLEAGNGTEVAKIKQRQANDNEFVVRLDSRFEIAKDTGDGIFRIVADKSTTNSPFVDVKVKENNGKVRVKPSDGRFEVVNQDIFQSSLNDAIIGLASDFDGNSGGPQRWVFKSIASDGRLLIRDKENLKDVLYFRSNKQSMGLEPQDLSTVSTASEDNGEIFRHNGANSISADGGTTSSPGYYVWSSGDNEWKSMVQY